MPGRRSAVTKREGELRSGGVLPDVQTHLLKGCAGAYPGNNEGLQSLNCSLLDDRLINATRPFMFRNVLFSAELFCFSLGSIF